MTLSKPVRWVLVLPTSAAATATAVGVILVTRPFYDSYVPGQEGMGYFAFLFALGVLPAFAWVVAGAVMAPSNEKIVARVLGVLGAVLVGFAYSTSTQQPWTSKFEVASRAFVAGTSVIMFLALGFSYSPDAWKKGGAPQKLVP